MSLVGWRLVALAILLLVEVIDPTAALAQADTVGARTGFRPGGVLPTMALPEHGFYAYPFFALTEVYDDNIFSSSTDRKTDFITRFTPGIQTGYRSPTFQLQSNVGFTAEIYAKHSELTTTDTLARQQASVNLQYQTSPLMTLYFNGNYQQSQTPIDLNAATGVEGRRETARVFSIGPGISYQFGPLTSATGGVKFTRSEQGGGSTNETYDGNLDFNRRITPQDTGGLGYTFSTFRFSGEGTSTSHGVRLTWTHQITPLTSFTLQGGPRFHEGSVDGDARASISRQLKNGRVEFTYSRSLTTVVGEAGTVNTDSFTLTFDYQPIHLLSVGASPGFYRNTQDGTESKTYRLNLFATYQLTNWLALAATYQFNHQQGNLFENGTAGGGEDFSHNIVSLALVGTYPFRR